MHQGTCGAERHASGAPRSSRGCANSDLLLPAPPLPRPPAPPCPPLPRRRGGVAAAATTAAASTAATAAAADASVPDGGGGVAAPPALDSGVGDAEAGAALAVGAGPCAAGAAAGGAPRECSRLRRRCGGRSFSSIATFTCAPAPQSAGAARGGRRLASEIVLRDGTAAGAIAPLSMADDAGKKALYATAAHTGLRQHHTICTDYKLTTVTRPLHA